MSKPSIFAIDFGTSNSLLCAAAPDEIFAPAPIDPNAADRSVLRSALYFSERGESTIGADAMRAFVDSGLRGRLIRSIKRHLPSRSFTSTSIGNKQVSLEALIACLLRPMRQRACEHFGVDVTDVLLGRPARFSNDPDDDALAQERLHRAAQLAGFVQISFCPEPLAAAYDFAPDLAEPRLVLVVDLGGGTSDFTLVRMSARGFAAEDVLSVSGIPTAGDAIDGAIVRSEISPSFGAQAQYRVPFGSNVLTMPRDLVELLCSPADLTFVDRRAVLKRLADLRAGLVDLSDRDKLDKFTAVVEDGVGFELYEAIEAVKRAVSERDSAQLSFRYPGAEIEHLVDRTGIERAASRPVDAIMSTLDDTLARAGVSHAEVEIVCLTGGTARMPYIQRRVREALPNAELRQLSSFHAVVQGLARRAQEIARGSAAP